MIPCSFAYQSIDPILLGLQCYKKKSFPVIPAKAGIQ
jgi:hypothetical protein